MHCSSSDLVVSTTCPTQLGCWHPMAFPAGTTAHCQSLLPEMDFLVCPTPLPAPTHTAVLVPVSPGPTLLMPAIASGQLASPSFQNSLAVRVSQALALLVYPFPVTVRWEMPLCHPMGSCHCPAVSPGRWLLPVPGSVFSSALRLVVWGCVFCLFFLRRQGTLRKGAGRFLEAPWFGVGR